ncbi:hypothetical protein EJ02DRAFT_337019 [Clathrospora elynae]|uniref:Rhodopsin domain-containing protein n=1 Tax=Clathrospora elynae TaxID=706981 RepID=A0A6A5T0K2_9PLEO|nr:hypothetical protein EJ02DRAFT_337019 [Clathrospora elynae]
MATATPEERGMWPQPNFEDPESRHRLVLGFVVPILLLSVLSVRFYGKGLMRQALGLDDYLMLAVMVFAIPISIFPLVSLNLGLGLHIWDLKEEWHTPYWKMAYTANLLFPVTCSLTKISLCLTYLKLFPNRSTKVFCYVMSAFVSCYTVACIFLSLFQAYWDTDVEPKCINMRVTLVVIAALNSFSDFLVYLWPAKPLWSLRLPMTQRFGLIFVFSVGLLVCIAGVLRIYYIEVFFQSYDTLWNGVPVWIAMVLELNIGVVCGCLSGVKPVMGVIFPTLFASSHRSRPKTYTRSNAPRSFAFQILPGVSGEACDKHMEHAVPTNELNRHAGNEQSNNFTCASSCGNSHVVSSVPANSIGIQISVTVEEEEIRSVTPNERDAKLTGLSDASSEEWILNDDGARRGV